MKLQSRNLAFGMQGNDIRELQRDLTWLGFDIPLQEKESNHFGKKTLAAVKMFQEKNNLEASGVVDPDTELVINGVLIELNRVVRGNILDTNEKPIKDATVRAFDKALRSEVLLGEALSDARGFYEINFNLSSPERVAPNLVVKEFEEPNANEPTAVSEVVFEADPETIINFVKGEGIYHGQSDFESVMKDIKAVTEDQVDSVANLQEDEENKDVTFLKRQTRLAEDHATYAILAHRHSAKSHVEPEVFYAFLRQGLPPEPSALLSQDSDVLKNAIIQAAEDNIIPQRFKSEDNIETTLKNLRTWRTQVALEDPPEPDQMTLGRLVKNTIDSQDKRSHFVETYAKHQGSLDEFWENLEQDDLLGEQAQDLKFAVQLSNLGQHHLPLITSVSQAPELNNINDLAKLDEQAWLEQISQPDVGTPPTIKGETDEEKAQNYARHLVNEVEAAIPNNFLVARLEETDLAGQRNILKFFRINSAFDIKNMRLESYLQENPDGLDGVADPAVTKRQLKGLQRVYRLAEKSKPTIELYKAGKDSAHSISRMGQNAFVNRFAQHFDSSEEAKIVYEKARQVSSSAHALIADVNPTMDSISMQAVPYRAPEDSEVEIPQWSTLFGSLDFCSCDACQSVYGPAAYLVDILHFLADRDAKLADTSVKDVLFSRRADLGEIELTCENTNTVLPYVDLVLEVLEDAVSPPPEFAPFDLEEAHVADLDQGNASSELQNAFVGQLSNQASIRIKRAGEWWMVDDLNFSYSIRKQDNGVPKVETRGRQTSGTQSERAANSQYINFSAYQKLESNEATFPWSLPFSLNLEETRVYLGHLGVPLHQVIETFLKGDRREVIQNLVLTKESLGLSAAEADLILNAAPEPWTHWGFSDDDNGSWLMEIAKVNEFLQRSRLTYRELLDLLQIQYINAANTLKIVSSDAEHPDTCDTEKLTLQGLTAELADRIERFVRLWRKLDWSIFDLDRAITALGQELNNGLLRQLFHLSRLQQHLGLTKRQILAFWAPLDTTHYINHDSHDKSVLPSLYDQLFRNPQVSQPLDPTFTADPANLTGKLVDYPESMATIAAALEISMTELSSLIQNRKVLPQGLDTDLNLDTLSQLYRHCILTKALKLQIEDHFRALKLLGNPFGSSTKAVLFTENVTKVKDSGLKFADLAYLLRRESEDSSSLIIKEASIVAQLQDIRQVMQQGATKDVIAQKIGESFGLGISTIQLLEKKPDVDDPNPQSYWESLMDPTLADASTPINRTNFPTQFAEVTFLHKLAKITSHFNIGLGMLEWLLEPGLNVAAPGLFDLKTLRTTSSVINLFEWQRLVDLLSLRNFMIDGEEGLLSLLELTTQNPAPSAEQVLTKLSEVTDWYPTNLKHLINTPLDSDIPDDFKTNLKYLIEKHFAFSVPNDFKNGKALLRLLACFEVLKRLGISAAQATKLSEVNVTTELARGVKQAARSKYDARQWSDIAKPLRDTLRKKQRLALVDYLVGMTGQDTNQLYGHYLIDVEMDPCMMTSRIKQAISSVQLFVQRCLMNLESEVLASAEQDDAWNWWKWMKNYRVWEANRKVFLYPENWIEPELRDDKSPFFKELESELLQSDLTLETAETAFLNYLEKLDNVARLDVAAVYHERQAEKDILHVFARTPADPPTYYYRQRVNSAYWTAWQKMDLDIEGNHLIPVLWNGRLFLFWPIFTEKAMPLKIEIPSLVDDDGVTIEDESKKYWEVKLAWSEWKQGKWTSKKISSKSIEVWQKDNDLAELSRVFFIPEVLGTSLYIYQYYVSKPNEEEFEPNIEGSYNKFIFGGCHLDPLVFWVGWSGVEIGYDALSLLRTERAYMFFREPVENETGLSLPIHTDLDNLQTALANIPNSDFEKYLIISQGADPKVTRHPFFYQDLFRNFLIIPKVSSNPVFDSPSEIGRVKPRSIQAMEPTNEREFAFQPSVVLGPDTHKMAPVTPRGNTTYNLQTFYHPYLCTLTSILNQQGLDKMLRREVQLEPHKFSPRGQPIDPFDFKATYNPSELIAQPYPTEEMDFSFSGSYAAYNWEIFFHAPLMIADQLTKNQRFEEATRWFHYIFDPTDTSSEDSPKRYWQTKEFFERTDEDYQKDRLKNLLTLLGKAKALRAKTNLSPEEQQELKRLNDLEASVTAWRNQPFKPHLVARMRTTAYQKAVVMKYLDNLIAWGDQLFRRDSIESINEATQLYILASEILGPRPVEIPPRLTARVQTYNSIEGLGLGVFSDPLVEFEELVPVNETPASEANAQQPPTMLYFGLPKNDKLLQYWDTVANRLFKIRHCMNIEGVVRQLPLFEPPIDPALLVRGAAAGIDLSNIFNDINLPLPKYRFNVLAQKATELCSELRSLGATLLATLEKRDAEELSLLRSKHETGLLEMIEETRQKQLDEAKEQQKALMASRNMTLGRLSHYQHLLGEGGSKIPAVGENVQEKDRPRFSDIVDIAGVKMFPHEIIENFLLRIALGFESAAAAQEFLGAMLHRLPDQNAMFMGVGVTISGIADAQLAEATSKRILASATQFGANLTSRLGSYIARELDWVFQHNQAAREIMQIDKQIIAAEIRTEIASLELRNHRKQMENAEEIETFMRDKFTNQDLYSWMTGQISSVYFQAYQLAFETAQRTEQAYRHELGLQEGDSNFIQFGYWDSLKKGLMAGEKLHHDLKRMEVSYLEKNEREFELTKHISLALLDPLALIKLRETGQCSIRLPEEIFDLDYPGHYFRRIKSVSITLPCVVGPYTTIPCTLRLIKHSIRINNNVDNGYPHNTDAQGDNRFIESHVPVIESHVPVGVIATSSAQNDSGVFELSFRDERYLPFEGAGVISEWSLELFNDKTKADFGKPLRQFDYNTISDAILHVSYTAKGDADTLKDKAIEHLRKYFSQDESMPSMRIFNLQQDFPTQWHQFLNPTDPVDGNIFELEISSSLFPTRDAEKTLKINTIWLLARCTNTDGYTVVMTPPLPDGSDPLVLARVNENEYGNLHFAKKEDADIELALTDPPVKWQLKVTPPGNENLQVDPLEIEDLMVVLGYSWS